MRHYIRAFVSKLVRRPPAPAPSRRPTLEQLEDRCLPSANMMMSMGMPTMPMNMQPMGMQAMTMPSANMSSTGMMSTTSNMMNPSTMAAINQLFTDFDKTLQQVLSSTTLQQFITNEAHMIGVLSADLSQIHMLTSPRGGNM
jgi:hypothetical protein